MITTSVDRQISLWDVNKFECLQSIKDNLSFPGFYSMTGYDEIANQLYVCGY
jgi:hypothetical protein